MPAAVKEPKAKSAPAPEAKAEVKPAPAKVEAEVKDDPLDIREPVDEDDEPKKEGAEAAAAGKEPGAAKEEAADEIPAELLARARDLDLSDDEIEEHESVAALERTIRSGEKMLSRIKAAPAKAAEEKQPAKVEAPADEELPDINVEEYDEKFVKLYTHAKKQEVIIKAFNEKFTKLEAKELARESAAFETKVDGLFEGLGEAYHEFVGKGSVRAMKAGKELETRKEIVGTMAGLAESYAKMGKTIPEAELFKRAAHAILGDKADAIARKKIGMTLEKGSRRLSFKPTHRDASENLTPKQRAIRKFDEEHPNAGRDDEDS